MRNRTNSRQLSTRSIAVLKISLSLPIIDCYSIKSPNFMIQKNRPVQPDYPWASRFCLFLGLIKRINAIWHRYLLTSVRQILFGV